MGRQDRKDGGQRLGQGGGRRRQDFYLDRYIVVQCNFQKVVFDVSGRVWYNIVQYQVRQVAFFFLVWYWFYYYYFFLIVFWFFCLEDRMDRLEIDSRQDGLDGQVSIKGQMKGQVNNEGLRQGQIGVDDQSRNVGLFIRIILGLGFMNCYQGVVNLVGFIQLWGYECRYFFLGFLR